MTGTKAPVVFIHGLWLHASSWQPWQELFAEAGYEPSAPGWPGDAGTVEATRANPDAVANKGIDEVTDHYAKIIDGLPARPVLIGHSFGGLIAQILAGRGLAAVTVAIDPAPFRGVLPLPLSALRVASGAVSNPANRHRAVPLTFDQFRYAFANAVTEEEAKQLFEAYAVPAPGLPLFQAVAANLNPWTEVKVDTDNPGRGPLLIISGEKDHTVPPAIANASYKHAVGPGNRVQPHAPTTKGERNDCSRARRAGGRRRGRASAVSLPAPDRGGSRAFPRHPIR